MTSWPYSWAWTRSFFGSILRNIVKIKFEKFVASEKCKQSCCEFNQRCRTTQKSIWVKCVYYFDQNFLRTWVQQRINGKVHSTVNSPRWTSCWQSIRQSLEAGNRRESGSCEKESKQVWSIASGDCKDRWGLRQMSMLLDVVYIIVRFQAWHSKKLNKSWTLTSLRK